MTRGREDNTLEPVPPDPSKYTLLLVGPLVHRMAPLLAPWGFRTEAYECGEDGLHELSTRFFHVVLVELELDDIEARDFLSRARTLQPDASLVLLDDPSRTHLIVSTLVHGVDAYVPTPPDERALLHTLLRQGFAAEARRTQDAAAELEALQRRVEVLEQENALLSAEVVDLNETLEDALKARQATTPGFTEKPRAGDADAEGPTEPEPLGIEEEILSILDEDEDDAPDWEAEPTVAHAPPAFGGFDDMPDTDTTAQGPGFEIDLDD